MKRALYKTPQEALESANSQDEPVNGVVYIEFALEDPATSKLHNLVGCMADAADLLAGFAILGKRQTAIRLIDWVERGFARTLEIGDPGDRWFAYEAALLARWLKSGTVEPDFVQQAADAFVDDVLQDVRWRQRQVMRLMEAGRLPEARALLHHRRLDEVPFTLHFRHSLSPSAALELAIDHAEGRDIEQHRADFMHLLSDLRFELFTLPNFITLVPWLRLDNRIFWHQSDPWKVMACVRGEPASPAATP